MGILCLCFVVDYTLFYFLKGCGARPHAVVQHVSLKFYFLLWNRPLVDCFLAKSGSGPFSSHCVSPPSHTHTLSPCCGAYWELLRNSWKETNHSRWYGLPRKRLLTGLLKIDMQIDIVLATVTPKLTLAKKRGFFWQETISDAGCRLFLLLFFKKRADFCKSQTSQTWTKLLSFIYFPKQKRILIGCYSD